MIFFAIIVTYNPNIEHIQLMCKPLIDEGLKVVLYDNTPGSANLSIIDDSIYLLGDGDNKGLSIAYNESIKFIESKYKRDEIEGFIFYDQDSEILQKNVKGLLSEYKFIKEQNIPLGGFGARPVNKEGKFYDVRKMKNQQYFPDKFIEMEFIISSFCLVPYSTIKKVGYYDEKLFIDLVNTHLDVLKMDL